LFNPSGGADADAVTLPARVSAAFGAVAGVVAATSCMPLEVRSDIKSINTYKSIIYAYKVIIHIHVVMCIHIYILGLRVNPKVKPAFGAIAGVVAATSCMPLEVRRSIQSGLL